MFAPLAGPALAGPKEEEGKTPAVPTISAGCLVVLHGLKTAELNDQKGEVALGGGAWPSQEPTFFVKRPLRGLRLLEETG